MTADASKDQTSMEARKAMERLTSGATLSLEDLIKMIPNKGDSVYVHGRRVTNNGTYTGVIGKGL